MGELRIGRMTVYDYPHEVECDAQSYEGNVWCNLSWHGEGMSGDYDNTNPEDMPLLRFTFYTKDEHGDATEIANGSYCTQLSLPQSMDEINAAAQIMANITQKTMSSGGNMKKVFEELSWAEWDWVERFTCDPDNIVTPFVYYFKRL